MLQLELCNVLGFAADTEVKNLISLLGGKASYSQGEDIDLGEFYLHYERDLERKTTKLLQYKLEKVEEMAKKDLPEKTMSEKTM